MQCKTRTKQVGDIMKLFSERIGIVPEKAIQVDGMDEDLRNRLWNAFYIFYCEERTASTETLMKKLILYHLKIPINRELLDWEKILIKIHDYFFKCNWYQVYDFVEFVYNECPDEDRNEDFLKYCNKLLEGEKSAYRFVGAKIIKVTSETEIKEIEEALDSTEPLKGVNIHLKTALDLLSDRKNPDYRNSIKESISAVESICELILGEKKTLGKALDKIEKEGNIEINPKLKEAFKHLYWYTSDAEGIRHALLDEPNLSFEDAKFMLVSCSAFVNYLIVKAEKAGIDLKGSM